MAQLVPQYDATKVLTGMAAIYLAPYSLETPVEMPPDTLALGEEWPAPWTPIGATTEGASFQYSRDTDTISIEEQMTPVDERTSSLTFTVEVELAQDTLQTMRWAYGGGTITTTAATASEPGISTLKISDEMEDLVLGLEGQNEFGFWRRIGVPRVKSRADVTTNYRRSANPRSYAVSLRSLVAPSQVSIRNMDAAKTGGA
ncbi:phage tail tube protein [Saccharopolyspora sp. NPDC002376]